MTDFDSSRRPISTGHEPSNARAKEALHQWMHEGIFVLTVASGSMSPTLEVGDELRVQKLGQSESASPRPGDIWVFRRSSSTDDRELIAHRVLCTGNGRHSGLVLTKGDACLRPDAWMPMARLVGKAIQMRRPSSDLGWQDLESPRVRRIGLVQSGWGSARCAIRALGRQFKMRKIIK